MDIKIKNYNGTFQAEGYWNKNTYKPNITNPPNLLRIYVGGKVLHITEEQYKEILDNKELGSGTRYEIISSRIKELDTEQKSWILIDLLKELSEKDLSDLREQDTKSLKLFSQELKNNLK